MRLENRIPPPVVALITALAMLAVSRVLPVVTGAGLVQAILASLLAGLGFTVAALGVLKFRALGTTIDPTHPERAATLAVGGIYRYSRNPMYLGFTLILLGWASWLGSIWGLAGPLLFVWYVGRFQIAPEERALRLRFGEAYDVYTRRVRRWL